MIKTDILLASLESYTIFDIGVTNGALQQLLLVSATKENKVFKTGVTERPGPRETRKGI